MPEGRYMCKLFYMQDFSNIILNVDDLSENQPALFCLNFSCTTNYTCNGSSLSNVHLVGFLKWEPFGNDTNGKEVLS